MMILGALLVASISAHVCLLSPAQRGGVDDSVNQVAAAACGEASGPCGSEGTAQPLVILRNNAPFTAVVQKNLDHWVAATPGYFTIDFASVADPTEQDFKQITQVADGAPATYPSGYLFFLNVTLTVKPLKHGVMRTRYVTNNPMAPPVFYACADVMVL